MGVEEQAPALVAPELWNSGAVIIIVGLLGWAVRLLRLLLTYVDMRYAVRQDATIFIRDIGSSVRALQHASMWHFQQLLRTKLEETATEMPRIRIPFDILVPSLRVDRWLDDMKRPKMNLTVRVKSAQKCAVQVLWNVRIDAIELSNRSPYGDATDGTASRKTGLSRLSSSVYRRLGMARHIRGSRGLPWPLSPVQRLDRRHRLDDEKEEEFKVDGDSATLALSWLGSKAFTSHSTIQSFDQGGEHEYTTDIPVSTLFGHHNSETASTVDEAGRGDDGDQIRTPRFGTAEVAPMEPRYGAVVIVGAASLFEDSKAQAARTLADGTAAYTEEALCQCIAIDFLPTPTRMPTVVKRFVFTPSNMYTQQEIFGGDTHEGECAICLEGELSVLLLPCRHFCVCRACLQEIERCPICRSKFSTYVCYAGADANAVKDGVASGQLELKVVDPLYSS